MVFVWIIESSDNWKGRVLSLKFAKDDFREITAMYSLTQIDQPYNLNNVCDKVNKLINF